MASRTRAPEQPGNLTAPLGSPIFDKLKGDGGELLSARYWKPSAPGDVILGCVEGFTTKMFPGKPPKEQTSAVLTQVMVFNLAGECVSAHQRLKLPLNTVLVEKVTTRTLNHPVAVEYQGMAATPAGEMRIFRAALIEEARHAKAWEKYGALAESDPGDASKPEEENDDLPF